MAPRTRSNRASTSKPTSADTAHGRTTSDGEVDVSEAENEQGVHAIEAYLSKSLKGVRRLRKDVADLRKKNARLQATLEEMKEQAESVSQPKRSARGAPNVRQLQKTVVELQKTVTTLEKRRAKDKQRIKKLEARELKDEAKDLLDQSELEIGDAPHKMRKLLRKFHDIMLWNVIGEDEECLICYDNLEVGKASSFTCEHTFCNRCISQLPVVGPNTAVSCPTCRKEVSREDLEEVEHTASQQWDMLLDVAGAWAKMDKRDEMDTSEEEEEEYAAATFIADGSSKASSPLSEPSKEDSDEESSPPPMPSQGRLRRVSVVRSSSVNSSVPGEDILPEVGETRSEAAQEAGAPPANSANGGPSTPPHSEDNIPEPQTPSYHASPAAGKRRILQELAQTRSKKRRL